MRGEDRTSGALFSYVDVEARIAANHPLRAMRRLTTRRWPSSAQGFPGFARGSGVPRLRRSDCCALCCCSFSIRSARSGQWVERLEFDMLFRWFVGLMIDEKVFDGFDLLEEPRPSAHPRDRARVSVFAPWPAGGEGASERRAFFGRWNDVESLGVDEELPSEGRLGRRPEVRPDPARAIRLNRGAMAKSTFARRSGRTRPTPRRRTRTHGSSAPRCSRAKEPSPDSDHDTNNSLLSLATWPTV